jgi:carboxymethylenebutenolidase
MGLERAGVPHEITTYPGAPHSFFDRKFEDYADASADAWARLLDFLDRLPVAKT